MSRIAAQVGGSKGTLYAHFRDKSDLFQACVARDLAGSEQAGAPTSADSHDLAAILRAHGREHLRRLLTLDALARLRLAIAEAGRRPAVGQAVLRTMWAARAEHLGAALEACGALPSATAARAMAERFLWLVTGPRVLEALLGPVALDAADLDAELETAVTATMSTPGVRSSITHPSTQSRAVGPTRSPGASDA